MEIISIDESVKWKEVVKEFEQHDVYYLSEYTKAFQIHGDGIPTLFLFKGERLKAMNVVMKRDIASDPKLKSFIPKNNYFDITTPYGYGGFVLQGEINDKDLEQLAKEYESVCRKENIVAEFVRFHPQLENHKHVNRIYDVSVIGKTVTIPLYSIDEIWSVSHSKNRNVIRKAIKSGVKIYWGRNEKLYDDFIELYNATMQRDNAEQYYFFDKEFYNSIIHDLKYNSTMFYATYEGDTIAMSIILHSNGMLNYHLSASNREYQKLAPTNLLLHEAACWGVENNFKSFHLGGGLGSKVDNLYKFKKAFNKNEDNDFAIGKRIFLPETYDELLNFRIENGDFNEETEYFPAYRG